MAALSTKGEENGATAKPRARLPRAPRRRTQQRAVGALLLLLLFILLVCGTMFMSVLRTHAQRLRTRLFSTSHRPRRHLIAFITDLDRESCRDTRNHYRPTTCASANVWVSYYKRAILPPLAPGRLTTVPLQWVDKTRLETRSITGARGMELSELVFLGDHLVAPDDRTGVLYEILSPRGALPTIATAFAPTHSATITPSILKRAVLRDGAGDGGAFKGEWAVNKDGVLVIGGHGRPVTDGAMNIRSRGPLWVKHVTPDFNVRHHNWTATYAKLDAAAGVRFPSYLMHEAVLWSALRREWVFLPRRRSEQPFDPVANEKRGWNCALIASESFGDVRTRFIPDLYDSTGLRGFSSAKFLPGSNDEIVVALRTIEVDAGNHGYAKRYTETFISAFNIVTGQVLLKETRVGYKKYEGLVFL